MKKPDMGVVWIVAVALLLGAGYLYSKHELSKKAEVAKSVADTTRAKVDSLIVTRAQVDTLANGLSEQDAKMQQQIVQSRKRIDYLEAQLRDLQSWRLRVIIGGQRR